MPGTHSHALIFKNDAVFIAIRVDECGLVLLEDILPAAATRRVQGSRHFDSSAAPLCEVRLSGEGNAQTKTSNALVGGYVGLRLKYKSHQTQDDDDGRTRKLDIEMHDDKTGVTVNCHFVIFQGLPLVRSSSTIRNDGTKDVVVTQLSSLVVAGMTRSPQWWADHVVSSATNTWFREAQWHDLSLPDVGLDDNALFPLHKDVHTATMATFGVSNRGTFSTQGHLPLGMLKRRDGGETWLWQVENNGSWEWQIGDFKDDVYLAATGPNAANHEWRQRLAPGASFTSATAALCHVFDDADAAFAVLTQYRRRIRRKHVDHDRLPIIFNDYMNCLMGDPTDKKILALIGPVARSGAEYFVIDAGWYADDNDWWDAVGEWEPSSTRFPMGFENLLGKIREAGLKPGLWVETEVVGVRSPIANALPEDGFFQRDGVRVLEKNRYQLDFRHPAVIKRMDGVMDRLVTQYGIGYLKFDYNIGVTEGTDVNASSAGVGQLDHNRAYLAWVAKLLDRYPALVIENCSSGAQRMDDAMNAVHTLQSTSDQQGPERYAAIAAAIHTAIAPEQGASWAYPQPDWDDETNALTVVNSMLGRVHLSGRLDLLSKKQLALVCDGMAVYKSIRGDIAASVPFWPLGLPKWHDTWLAAGLRIVEGSAAGTSPGGAKCYLAVWRRGGEKPSCRMPVRGFSKGENVSVRLLYPVDFPVETAWDASSSSLHVTMPPKTCARLFCLTLGRSETVPSAPPLRD